MISYLSCVSLTPGVTFSWTMSSIWAPTETRTTVLINGVVFDITGILITIPASQHTCSTSLHSPWYIPWLSKAQSVGPLLPGPWGISCLKVGLKVDRGDRKRNQQHLSLGWSKKHPMCLSMPVKKSAPQDCPTRTIDSNGTNLSIFFIILTHSYAKLEIIFR